MANSERIQISKNSSPLRHSEDIIIAQSFYAPDSSARQIEVAYPEPAYQPERRNDTLPPAPRPKKQRRAKTKPEFVEDIQARHRHNFLSYALIFAFFGGLALILALNARFDYYRLTLEAERTHLASLQNSNEARASEIYATLDLEQIEIFAIEHLGMMPPEDFQIMEIVVTPQSFFSASPTDTPATDGFSFNRFWNILFSFD